MRLLAPLALLLATLALVACGGDGSSSTGGQSVGSDEDAATILDKTFSTGTKTIEKGKLDLSVKINATGGDTSLGGPIDVKLSGPFENRGAGKVPALDMDLVFSGGGQDLQGNLTTTGDKAFVGFNGQDYAVDDATFDQFETSLKNQKTSPLDFKKLGLEPATWLNDPKNAGDSSVGDTDTIKITASSLNVPVMLRDLSDFAQKAPSLGLSGAVPDRITDDQIRMAEDAIKTSSVEIETGKDDSILRRLAVKLSADQGGQQADVDFDLSLTDLGEDQGIEAPTDTKPLAELLNQPGGLGGLLGQFGASGSSGSATAPAPSGADQQAAQKYSQCVQEAGSDTAKLQQCADLLTP